MKKLAIFLFVFSTTLLDLSCSNVPNTKEDAMDSVFQEGVRKKSEVTEEMAHKKALIDSSTVKKLQYLQLKDSGHPIHITSK